MTVSAGDRLGSFEILSAIGAGGMGEVYRARDLRLNRDVAIKVLPEAFAADSERVARFAREAQLLAALNHPHIATIYGLEEVNGSQLLVLELIQGGTLADRLVHGPLPLREACTLARQIADALAAAHAKGIIHRDLKPANVALNTDSQAKVLDFGLAKEIEERPSSDVSNLSTLMRQTQPGVMLGTPAYMSPEQLRGRALDKRSDIWAFGCLLYEMLTGHQALGRETVSDTVAGILEREPDWRSLPAHTPARVRWLLRRCLEKDLNRRLHDIADARIELDEALSEPGESSPDTSGDRSTAARRPIGSRAGRIVAGLGLATLIAVLAFRAGFSSRPASVDAPAYLASIPLPESVNLSTSPAGRFAVSPDGRRLAFSGTDKTGRTQLWIRSFDGAVAQPLAGTDGATFPFWSHDSRFVAFLSQGKLKKVEATGGPTTTLTDAASNSTGAWSRDDVILFTPKGGEPLYRISALGGTPTPATTLDAANGDAQHWFPQFLPDGRHFLYFVLGSKTGGAIDPRAVYVGSLDPKESSKFLLEGGSNAKYADGHLLFLKGRTLMAQPFDLARLELVRQPVSVAEQVQVPGAGDTGTAGAFSVADTGAIVYQAGLDEVRSQLAWFDRQGKQTALLGEKADYAEVSLSPDGRQAAVSVLDPTRGVSNLWLYDVARGLPTRFTSNASHDIAPVWSRDLSRILFASGRKGGFDVYQKTISGPSEDPVLEDTLGEFPQSISPDGQFLLYVFGSGTLRRSDLWILSLTEGGKRFPFKDTPSTETQGQFSPDGKWIAYSSNESGRYEVYVAPLSGSAGHRISPAGGSWPRWRRDGNEIVYLAPDNTLTSASVRSEGSDLVVGSVRPLFTVRLRPLVRLDAFPYDISPDGQRFLVNTFVEETASTAITLIVNWTAALGH